MPKVSVIIPIFGVEKYIERCARSLFEQTLDDIEYIFVDDFTPDKSIEILRSVISEYPHRALQTQILFHKVNQGLPIARKTGIEVATGEYITHCDSDDWVQETTYELAYRKAKEQETDILFFDYWFAKSTTKKQEYHKNLYLKNKKRLLAKMLTGYTDASPVWSALVKKSIYENKIIFPKHNQMEDKVLMYQCIFYAKTMTYFPECLYYYYQNPSSMGRICGEKQEISRWENRRDNYELLFHFNAENNLDLMDAESCCKFILQSSQPYSPKQKIYPDISLKNMLTNYWFYLYFFETRIPYVSKIINICRNI